MRYAEDPQGFAFHCVLTILFGLINKVIVHHERSEHMHVMRVMTV